MSLGLLLCAVTQYCVYVGLDAVYCYRPTSVVCLSQ